MNTAKLVKKPVQVRGKNGKIYTRMQWVDPRTGQPVSKEHAQPIESEKNPATQKEFIDAHVKKMSNDEKYDHLKKHGIDWKHNDHPQIDHKNAVMALKDHLYKNPHLAGAEHLPKEQDPSVKPDGDDRIQNLLNKHKKNPEALYNMMKHAGIVDRDEQDPRTVPGQQAKADGGNGMGAIKHMHNTMKFKKHLKENPDLLDHYENHPDFQVPAKGKPKLADPEAKLAPPPPPSKDKAPQSTAQKAGGTIEGVLKSMPREKQYDYMKKLGIADIDPATDPGVDPKMRPIVHMRNVMKLKKAIQEKPELLNEDPEVGGLSDDEKSRLSELKGKSKTEEEVSDFLKRASKGLKLQWADDYSDHDEMKNREKNKHENIDYMKKMEALKKILIKDPSIMDELKPELDREELLSMKISNKAMRKVLRQVAGLKGEAINDIVAGFEKGRQWEWGVDSTAEITEDDEGEPILSIVDTGKDGEEYNEMVFPLSKVKDFLDGETKEVKQKEVPLSKKAPQEIWKALNEDFKGNYNKDVGDALKPEMLKLWEATGRKNTVTGLCNVAPVQIGKDTMKSLLKEYGVPIHDGGMVSTFDHRSEAWKKAVYSHLVEDKKSKNAIDYLQKDPGTGMDTDTWVLHESAKKWSPDERAQARKDFITHRLNIDDLGVPDAEDRKVKITDYIHKSTEYAPFDLLTDIFANGCKLNFTKKNRFGEDVNGCYHLIGDVNHPTDEIYMNRAYLTNPSLMETTHPSEHGNFLYSVGTAQYRTHPFSDTMAHEFAHAMDHFLSTGTSENYCDWNSKRGEKYAKGHENTISDSYKHAVEKSNPDIQLGEGGSGDSQYILHLDTWMSNYEGRVYDRRYYNQPEEYMRYDSSTGKAYDKNWGGSMTYKGIEHWSENVSRYANALGQFKKWKQDTNDSNTNFDTWVDKMHKSFVDKGLGDDSTEYLQSYSGRNFQNRNDNMPEAYGYLYKEMQKRHPIMHNGIKAILDRPDFVGDKSVARPSELANQNDFTRKSIDLIIDL